MPWATSAQANSTISASVTTSIRLATGLFAVSSSSSSLSTAIQLATNVICSASATGVLTAGIVFAPGERVTVTYVGDPYQVLLTGNMHSFKIERTRGDNYADAFIVRKSNGNVANLSECSFKMTLNSLQAPVDTTTQLYQMIGEVPDASTGEVIFYPTDDQVNHVGCYYFDVQMIDSTGVIRTLAAGSYTYVQDITM